MNEIIIVDHPGNYINDLIDIGIETVKITTVSYAMFNFNGVKVFIKKDTTKQSAMDEYLEKLKATMNQ